MSLLGKIRQQVDRGIKYFNPPPPLAPPPPTPPAPDPDPDPTELPPPTYTSERAEQVIGESFRRCFEYVKCVLYSGDVLEFGTFRGYTAKRMARLMAEMQFPGKLWLYDSFEGLPDCNVEGDRDSYEVQSNKVWFEGCMALDKGIEHRIQRALLEYLPSERLSITKGFFDQTFDAHHPTEPAALVHVDCDLYSSSRFVLDRLLDFNLLKDGTLLVFDDFNCNRANPKMGERRALAESFGRQDRFTYSPFFSYGWHGQVFFVHDQTVSGVAAA
jgi:hypothetical protein